MAARSRRALLDPRAAGTTDLIEPGATLVTDASDIIQTVAPILACARTTTSCLPRIREPTKRERLAGLLGPTPVSIDELIRMAGLSPAIVRILLLELELTSRLERHGGGMVSLI